MNCVHSTAVIDPKCTLGTNVHIGAYTVVGANVAIGDGCRILNSATIIGPTKIGARCSISPYTVIGGDSQDKKFEPDKRVGTLEIGEDCLIREHTTINRGSFGDHCKTVIGNRNHILSYCHIAHDCILGDDVTFSNNVALAGHVKMGNGATAGGYVGVHQFSEIGEHCMISSRALVKSNIPPYLLVHGQDHAKVVKINTVGLNRAGFSEMETKTIEKAFKIFYRRKDLLKNELLDVLKKELRHEPVIIPFIHFIETHQNICPAQ